MLKVMKSAAKKIIANEEMKKKDLGELIVTRSNPTLRVNEAGRLEMVTKYKKVNISRMVNETKKLIKAETAAEKLAEIQKVFSK